MSIVSSWPDDRSGLQRYERGVISWRGVEASSTYDGESCCSKLQEGSDMEGDVIEDIDDEGGEWYCR